MARITNSTTNTVAASKNKINTNAAAQLRAAREEVEQLRAERAAYEAQLEQLSAQAAAAHAQATQPQPQHAHIEALFDGVQFPSATRVIVGMLLGLAASFTVGYGIGMLMAYALAGIATLTSSALLAFMLSVVVWVLGLYAAWKVGGYVGGKVFASVVLPEGLASRSYASVANAASNAKASVGGWFESKPRSIKEFTGAFVKPSAA